MTPLRAACVALAAVALCAPAALATHDGGTRYELIRMADDGTLLVSECHIQGDPGRLLVLSKKGKRLALLDVKESKDLPYCNDTRRVANDTDLDKKLGGAVTKYGLIHQAVRTSAMSPSGTRFVADGVKPDGIDLRLVEGGKITRKKTVKAKPGFSTFNIDAQFVWHPDERYVVVVGQRVARVQEAVQTWEPFLVHWTARKKKPRRNTPQHLAKVWYGLGKGLLKKCKKDEDYCQHAERDFTNALEMVPDHAKATAARAKVDAYREAHRLAAEKRRQRGK